MDTKREKSACFTGHRAMNYNEKIKIQKRLKYEIGQLIESGIIYFYNGGALGFDTLAAVAVLAARDIYPQIKLIMALPCPEQADKWSADEKAIYTEILKAADEVIYTSDRYTSNCMRIRNKYLVDNSGHCIAYLNKLKGGTAFTVSYAREQGLSIKNISTKSTENFAVF